MFFLLLRIVINIELYFINISFRFLKTLSIEHTVGTLYYIMTLQMRVDYSKYDALILNATIILK